MNCPKCKKELPNEAKFCLHCGTKIEVDDTTIECPSCHARIPIDSKFCPDCGNVINTIKRELDPINIYALHDVQSFWNLLTKTFQLLDRLDVGTHILTNELSYTRENDLIKIVLPQEVESGNSIVLLSYQDWKNAPSVYMAKAKDLFQNLNKGNKKILVLTDRSKFRSTSCRDDDFETYEICMKEDLEKMALSETAERCIATYNLEEAEKSEKESLGLLLEILQFFYPDFMIPSGYEKGTWLFLEF